MSHYGEYLGTYEPDKQNIYDAFVSFFNNPTMTKIKDIDNMFSMYMTKTYCLLNRDCRYIVILINKDNRSIGSVDLLSSFYWFSLQTRTFSQNEKYNLPSHSYNAVRGGLLDKPIFRTELTDEASIYKCDELKLSITLLHTKNDHNEYIEKGNVLQALETYQTIVTFL